MSRVMYRLTCLNQYTISTFSAVTNQSRVARPNKWDRSDFHGFSSAIHRIQQDKPLNTAKSSFYAISLLGPFINMCFSCTFPLLLQPVIPPIIYIAYFLINAQLYQARQLDIYKAREIRNSARTITHEMVSADLYFTCDLMTLRREKRISEKLLVQALIKNYTSLLVLFITTVKEKRAQFGRKENKNDGTIF